MCSPLRGYELVETSAKGVPQRLKPQGGQNVYGTAEAVPLIETERFN